MKSLVHKTARDFGGRAIQACDHQYSVRRIKRGRICEAKQRILARAHQRQLLFNAGQEGQFRVDRSLVAAQFRAHFVIPDLLKIRIPGDAHWNAVTKHSITNFGFFDFPVDPRRLAVRRADNLRSNMPKPFFFQYPGQRCLKRVAEFRARHFQGRAERETENLVHRNVPGFCVIVGDFFRFRHAGIVNNDDFVPRIRAVQREGEGGEQGCKQNINILHGMA